ncbi:MAG: 2-oxoglutarate dehydrogenase complex dihydrolipoyllysine-residue succinyltransferase [Acidobacteriota bacterium]|nr:2-oxoglutarate dehydrogenase complex dihydrolipoyllysine-residue succinyltransferase [Acidobacteriota bacterium]
MAIELKVPSAGESITEVVIGDWLIDEGSFVEVDDDVVVIETDKASMELPAPVSGTLTKILVQTGDTVEVGAVIGLMEEGEADSGDGGESDDDEEAAEDDSSDSGDEAAAEEDSAGEDDSGEESGEPRIMPAAQRLLDEHGLKASAVRATGPGGRLLKEDVQRHLDGGEDKADDKKADGKKKEAAKKSPEKKSGEKKPASSPARPAGQASGGSRQEETVRMTTLRKLIAERLVGAQQDAALLTTFNEVDMSAVMNLRRAHQEAFKKRYGIKVGFMSFFVKAVIEGLKEIPGLNAEIRDGNIVYKNYYDIGVAVGGGKGLVVPVIRNTERLSFAEIEQAIADLATRARDNELSPDELQGGTFTISNGGIYGSMLSTPIVNPPQSGILGMHNIVERPVAVDGEVVIRPIMYLALTYDHRVVDGREAVTFLVRVKECLEDPARMLLEV